MAQGRHVLIEPVFCAGVVLLGLAFGPARGHGRSSRYASRDFKGAVIRQIAALPYRTEGDSIDAPIRILLITSRNSKRWVIPKGNTTAGMELHQAAARKAEEEAGVLGAVCPIALGTYRYRTQRRSGASLMADVEVFPLAVSRELDEWEEKEVRHREWFSLTEAAKLVDESDLRDLMRSFGASQFRLAANRDGLMEAVVRKSRFADMFSWFQKLLPKTGNFFELFEAHAAATMAGADALMRLLQDPDHRQDHIREVTERETDADEIIRRTVQLVRQTFLTPFDRTAIISLVSAMDDAIDEMRGTVGAIDLYDVRDFDHELKDMGGIIVDCARLVTEATPLLRDVAANAERLNELTERITRLEEYTDELHRMALKKLFRETGETETRRFIAISQIYNHMEEVVDAFDDVAKEINGIVVEQA